MINVNDKIKIVKGCAARCLDKGVTAQVIAIDAMGADFSHCVKVTFRPINGFQSGKTFCFFARHMNRLSDPVVRMNDGNPLHTIQVVTL